MQRITIKDIAEKCAISPTVASAALRGKKGGTIAYSKETLKNVLRVAKELGYRPNRLAQAMKSGITPVVAVSLHIDFKNENAINFYLHDTLPQAALRLHELNLEMLFLPYYEHNEQINRLNELFDDHLIGGVISNYIQGEEEKLLNFHEQTEIPLVILGKLKSPIVPSISINEKNINQSILDFAKKKSFKKVYFSEFKISGKLNFKELQDNNLIATTCDNISQQNTLFVINGERQKNKLLDIKKLTENQILLVEDFRMPVRSKYVLHIKPKTAERAILAAELAESWIKNGTPPSVKQHEIDATRKDYRIITY